MSVYFRESRYLLVLTENYAALPIVLQELHEKKEEPIVIFGSSFPKDQEFTQVLAKHRKVLILLIAVGLRGYRNVLDFEAFSKCLHLYFRSAGTLIELRCAWKPDGL